MGNSTLLVKHMMKTVICLAVFITIAYALPNTDSVVPEVEMLQVNAFQEAQDYVTELLQDGKDQGACADLAAATIKEVEDEVANQQKILDSLDTGADCPNKGQAAVDSAQSALDQANKDKTDADAAASSAANAPVNIAPKPLSSLTPGECAPFFSDPAYVAAVAAAESAKTAATQAAGAVTGAQAGLKAAQDAQQEAIKACQCAVRAAYNKAWAAANANNDENTKAFTKGEHMKCVLDATPPADCQVGDTPKVSAITLAAGVPDSVCTEAPTPVPTPVPTTPEPTPVPTPNPTPNPTPTPTAPIQYDLGTGITGCTGATTYAGLGSCSSGASEQHVADFWCKKGNFGGTATSWTTFKGTSGPMCYIQGSNPASVIDKTGSVKFMRGYGCSGQCKCLQNIKCLNQ